MSAARSWQGKALKVSVILNLVLVATCVYFLAQGKPFIYHSQTEKVASRVDHWQSNLEILQTFYSLPFDQLVLQLGDVRRVEDGFCRRDLALACLVSLYHFDIAKALGEKPKQERQLLLKDASGHQLGEIVAFPGISESQFQEIIHYAHVERWPVSDEGLFKILAIQGVADADPSLIQAFSFSPEFLTIESLFKRTGVSVDRRLLLEIILGGDWNLLEHSFREIVRAQDFSDVRRRQFLFQYIRLGSQLAARLFLATDMNFAVKRLEDREVLFLLGMFYEDNPQAKQLALELLTSPRSDAVWEKAASCLYAYENEPMPEPYDHLQAIRRFVPQELLGQRVSLGESSLVTPPPSTAQQIVKTVHREPPVQEKPVVKTSVKGKKHTVVEGDSLWRLSRQYGVSIEKIKEANELTSDHLRPGRILIIPSRS